MSGPEVADRTSTDDKNLIPLVTGDAADAMAGANLLTPLLSPRRGARISDYELNVITFGEMTAQIV